MSYVASASATQIMTPSPLFYANLSSPIEESIEKWGDKWVTAEAPLQPPNFLDQEKKATEEEDEGEEVRRFVEFMSGRSEWKAGENLTVPTNTNPMQPIIAITPPPYQQQPIKQDPVSDVTLEMEKGMVLDDEEKKEDDLFRRNMMARLFKNNGLANMNPKKRRRRQLKYMQFIDKLIAEYRAQVEDDKNWKPPAHDEEYEEEYNEE